MSFYAIPVFPLIVKGIKCFFYSLLMFERPVLNGPGAKFLQSVSMYIYDMYLQ